MIFGDDETIATLLLNMSQAKAASKEKEKGVELRELESDEELTRKIQEEWETEEERNKIAEEKATNEALIKNFDDIKARIEEDKHPRIFEFRLTMSIFDFLGSGLTYKN
ncbi:hypothetical protein Tco_0275222, partial [Tanacetum coccineum]